MRKTNMTIVLAEIVDKMGSAYEFWLFGLLFGGAAYYVSRCSGPGGRHGPRGSKGGSVPARPQNVGLLSQER
jgi:hypothetical protein